MSYRPFVVNTTFSTGLVGVEVTTVQNKGKLFLIKQDVKIEGAFFEQLLKKKFVNANAFDLNNSLKMNPHVHVQRNIQDKHTHTYTRTHARTHAHPPVYMRLAQAI